MKYCALQPSHNMGMANLSLEGQVAVLKQRCTGLEDLIQCKEEVNPEIYLCHIPAPLLYCPSLLNVSEGSILARPVRVCETTLFITYFRVIPRNLACAASLVVQHLFFLGWFAGHSSSD
jgi:hypothetical protein